MSYYPRANLFPWIFAAIASYLLGKLLNGNLYLFILTGILAVGITVYAIKKYFAEIVVAIIFCLAVFTIYTIFKQDQKLASTKSTTQNSIKILAPQYSYCPQLQKFRTEIQKWCDLITVSANSYGLDPILIASIIEHESKGDPNAISTSGAIGIMQVMPFEANQAMFWDRPTRSELFDPKTNIQEGARILSQNISYYVDIRNAILHYGPIDVGYTYADSVISTYNNSK